MYVLDNGYTAFALFSGAGIISPEGEVIDVAHSGCRFGEPDLVGVADQAALAICQDRKVAAAVVDILRFFYYLA